MDYSAKLTGEPFLYPETKIIAEYILKGFEVSTLKKKNIEENLIQYKSKSAIVRVNSAIFRRLSVLNDEMLELFTKDDIPTSKIILLYAIMKTDKLVNDFIYEVYREKIMMMKDYIETYDIINWFDFKFSNSPNLCKVSESTKYKLKQVLLKIMVDSGLLIKEKQNYKIIAPLYNEKINNLLSSVGDEEFYKSIGGFLWKQ